MANKKTKVSLPQSSESAEADPFTPTHLTPPAPSRPNLFTLDSLRSDHSPFSSASKSKSHKTTDAASPSDLSHKSQAPPQIPAAVADPPWHEYNLELMLRWCKGKNTSFLFLWELNMDRRITFIQGVVFCKACNIKYVEEYDVATQLGKVYGTSLEHGESIENTKLAPRIWCEPPKHRCRICKRKKVTRPVIAAKKKEINYLFLFCGQDLGLCSLEQLNYFVKHNRQPGGAMDDPQPFNKPHLLYCCYKEICMQLMPKLWSSG